MMTSYFHNIVCMKANGMNMFHMFAVSAMGDRGNSSADLWLIEQLVTTILKIQTAIITWLPRRMRGGAYAPRIDKSIAERQFPVKLYALKLRVSIRHTILRIGSALTCQFSVRRDCVHVK